MTSPTLYGAVMLTDEQRQAILHQCRLYLDDEGGKYDARSVLTRIFSLAAAPAAPAHCQCPACKDGAIHASDCAVHNAPALPVGECDCGTAAPAKSGEPVAWRHKWVNDASNVWQYETARPQTDKLRIGVPGILRPDKARDQWEPLYAAPQPTQPAKEGEAAKRRDESWLDAVHGKPTEKSAVVLGDERATFEAWMLTCELDASPNLERDGEFYDEFNVQRAWRGWQARAASPQAAATLAAHTDDSRDAARYRWLREHWGYLSETYDTDSSRMVSLGLLQESAIEDGWDVEPTSLDAAVDANLTAAQPASGGDRG